MRFPSRPTPLVLLLVVALPVATLIAGGWTLAVIGGEGLDTVADPVRRTAQVQQVDHAADRLAAHLGLAAELRRTADGLALTLSATKHHVRDAGLVLRLEHPLDAQRDLEWPLRENDGVWSGPAFDVEPAWRVALSPADGDWRLVGRWPRGGESLRLLPAVVDAPERPDGAR